MYPPGIKHASWKRNGEFSSHTRFDSERVLVPDIYHSLLSLVKLERETSQSLSLGHLVMAPTVYNKRNDVNMSIISAARGMFSEVSSESAGRRLPKETTHGKGGFIT